jgi:beta-glucosidase
MGLPEGFLWGTCASSTQSEGAAPASDWRAWEDAGRAPPSGDGNGFATRYREDLALYAEHGLTHHRLSLEWARIEPRAGHRDPDAVDHYIDVLRAARDAGIRTWVCLHHFTLPGWFSEDEGGFLDDRSRTRFWQRHVAFCAETFGDLVHGWKPINEPAAYALTGFRLGIHPPGRRDPENFRKALRGILLAGRDAWRELRGGGPPVATVHNVSPVVRLADTDLARQRAELAEVTIWRSWLRAVRDGVIDLPGGAIEEVPDLRDSCDIVGFSYYAAQGVAADGSFVPYPTDAKVGPMG